MDLNRRTDIDDLLGAWALAAVDDDELAAVDTFLDRDVELARVGATLAGVVATLAEPLATAPPEGLRPRVLGAATAAGQVDASPVAAANPVEVYAAQVEALGDELARVEPADWSSEVAAFGWPLDRLARHLLEVERHFASLIGSPDLRPSEPAPDHLALGAPESTGEDPAATAAEWAATATDAVSVAQSLPAELLDRHVSIHGIPMTLGSLFVVRGFELWTHADDVRRSLGHPLGAPAPAELRTMADHAVRGLPSLLLLAGIEPPPVPVRVVLTGRGGGTWDVDLDLEAQPGSTPAGPPRAVIVADVVDYCRLASRRIAVDDLHHDVEGDAGLVRQLLVAAQAIAF